MAGRGVEWEKIGREREKGKGDRQTDRKTGRQTDGTRTPSVLILLLNCTRTLEGINGSGISSPLVLPVPLHKTCKQAPRLLSSL